MEIQLVAPSGDQTLLEKSQCVFDNTLLHQSISLDFMLELWKKMTNLSKPAGFGHGSKSPKEASGSRSPYETCPLRLKPGPFRQPQAACRSPKPSGRAVVEVEADEA